MIWKKKIKLHHFLPWNKNKFKVDYNLNVKKQMNLKEI